MISVNLEGKVVLVTGGTRGLGRAIALDFTRAGATVFVTHRWGSVSEEELDAIFKAENLKPPRMIEADASDGEATRALMKEIKTSAGRLDVVVSNVALARAVQSLADMKKSTLDLSISYSAWPLVDLMQASQEVLGKLPRYLLAISGDGVDVCHENYEMVGASKAVLEALVRYLAVRLKPEGTRVNALRPWVLDTDNLRNFFEPSRVEAVKKEHGEIFMDPARVAGTCVALCSGLMDAVTGQVITVDEGWGLLSPTAWLAGQKRPFSFPEGG
jgi:NAD(P)-dependent dehydrogenase (short-subunit alcohol dehydrogenase family)